MVNMEIFNSSNKEWDTETFKSFIDGLPSGVTFIQLKFSCQGSLDFRELCMKLHQKCPQLEVLILKRCIISTILPEAVNSCTQFLQGLKKLVLRYCHFTDYSGTAELEDNSNIEVLDLNWSFLLPSSKIQFSKLLSLTELRLAHTSVDDFWFISDTSFLNRLQVLDLGWTCVTAITFNTIVEHEQNLKELYLCNLRLHFSFNGPVFPHLQRLCASCTRVTGDGLLCIVRTYPSLVTVYALEDVARSFSEHPLVVTRPWNLRIVKSVDFLHDHNVDYSPN